MRDYKVVWIASMPRSGSTWAYNVTRSLFRHAGFQVAPELIPTSEEEIARIGYKAQRDTSANVVWCLKSHLIFKNPPPVNRFISTFRDPREALFSYMRFTRCDFDEAINAAKIWKQICTTYRSMPGNVALCLDYEDIVEAPLGIGARIAAFLGLEVDHNALEEIIREFSRDKVRERIASLEKNLQWSSVLSDVTMIVPNIDGTIRVCDRRTGFQSEHISDFDMHESDFLLSEQQRHVLDTVVGTAW